MEEVIRRIEEEIENCYLEERKCGVIVHGIEYIQGLRRAREIIRENENILCQNCKHWRNGNNIVGICERDYQKTKYNFKCEEYEEEK